MILITGANGFVGSALCRYFDCTGEKYIRGLRTSEKNGDIGYGDIRNYSNWKNDLKGVSAIIHLAALVHQMEGVLEEEYIEINCNVTFKLASAAKKAGVRRFVYCSTAKVLGESSSLDGILESSRPRLTDSYSISKRMAEDKLLELHESGKFDVVIVRPPLVYGSTASANFKLLFKLVSCVPILPFYFVNNRRSLVSVYNLADFFNTCIHHPNAVGQAFNVTDEKPYSLKELVQLISKVLQKKIFFLPVPIIFMKIVLFVFGKKNYINRLFGNFYISNQKSKELLHWSPPFSFLDTFKGNEKHQVRE